MLKNSDKTVLIRLKRMGLSPLKLALCALCLYGLDVNLIGIALTLCKENGLSDSWDDYK